jgi:photosystem II stability/assembly factor-like uncharacterized protein
VYWSKQGKKLLDSSAPLGSIAKGKVPLSISLTNVEKPSDASEILILTSNKDGEMSEGVSIPIVDLGVPQHAAVSVGFSDTNKIARKLSGKIEISRAADETDVNDYIVYWAQLSGNRVVKLSGLQPLGSVNKSIVDLSLDISDVTIPFDASHLVVLTKNNAGEMSEGASAFIIDAGVPENPPVNVEFEDLDERGRFIAGPIKITRALKEEDITTYAVYWARNGEKLQSHPNPIAIVGKENDPLVAQLTEVQLPSEVNSLLVLSRNNDGEMSIGKTTLILDKGVPNNAATSVEFSDQNNEVGKLTGSILVTKAIDESDIDEYRIYWGDHMGRKLRNHPSPIGILKKGAGMSLSLTDIDIPSDAHRFVAISANDAGERISGVTVLINDSGIPTNKAQGLTFFDKNLSRRRLSGTIQIKRAIDESAISHYAIYWRAFEPCVGFSGLARHDCERMIDIGSRRREDYPDAAFKLSGNSEPIAVISKNESQLSFELNDVIIPNYANGLMVFTRLGSGEMDSAVSIENVDENFSPSGVVVFNDTIYISDFHNGIFFSRDNGSTWTNISLNHAATSNSVRRVFLDGTTIYVATSHDGILYSKNDGLTWKKKTHSDGIISRETLNVHASGENIYVSTQYGLSVSTDGGRSWINRSTNDGLAFRWIHQTLPVEGQLYAATSHGLSVSTNGGNTWSVKNIGSGSSPVLRVFKSENRIFAITYNNGAFISSDGGSTWGRASSSLSECQNLRDGFAEGRNIYLLSDKNLCFSKDGGATWSAGPQNFVGMGYNSIAKKDGNIFIAGFIPGAAMSTDNGQSWTSINDRFKFKEGLAWFANGKTPFLGEDASPYIGVCSFKSEVAGQSCSTLNSQCLSSSCISGSGTNCERQIFKCLTKGEPSQYFYRWVSDTPAAEVQNISYCEQSRDIAGSNCSVENSFCKSPFRTPSGALKLFKCTF